MSRVLAAVCLLFVATSVSSASRPATTTRDAAVSAVPTPTNPQEVHPRIRAAIKALQEARAELQAAAHDFQGHRVDAIKAIDAALTQLNICLKIDK